MNGPFSNFFKTRPCGKGAGVEVLDVDLRQPLSDAQIYALRALYREHHLLLFRNQTLDDAQHLRVAGWFGPVLPGFDGLSWLSNVSGKGILGATELAYHSDWAFSRYPLRALSLYAEDVVDEATSTRFINSMKAVGKLAPEVREKLERYEALHVYGANMATRNRIDTIAETHPRHTHPVLMRHPDSGEPVLYIALNQTDSIVGLPADESEALIKQAFDALYQDDNLTEHRWRKGDMVIWDNVVLQHARGDVSNAGPRTLRRIALGERGFYEMYPHMDQSLYETKAETQGAIGAIGALAA